MSAGPAGFADDEAVAVAVALAAAVRLALVTGTRMVDPTALEETCARDGGLDHQAWFAAMEGLFRRGLVQMRTAPPSHVQLLALRDQAVLDHEASERADFDDVQRRVWAAVSQTPLGQAVALHEQVGEPALLVEVLLDRWVLERRLVYSKAPGRRFRAHKVLAGR